MSNQSRNASIASMAAMLALSFSALAAENPTGAAGVAVAGGDKVHCFGVNSCKGQADCKTAKNECKGQGSCKGLGFKATTAKSCLDQNGTISDLSK